MNVRNADLVLVRGATTIPVAIERITHSPYSHVAGITKPNTLVEAQAFHRTGEQRLLTYKGCADIYRCPMLTDVQRRHIVAYVEREIGTRYDYALIAWELLRYALNVVLPYIETESYICSTLWADAYKSAGVDLCPGVKYASPADIAHSKLLVNVGAL